MKLHDLVKTIVIGGVIVGAIYGKSMIDKNKKGLSDVMNHIKIQNNYKSGQILLDLDIKKNNSEKYTIENKQNIKNFLTYECKKENKEFKNIEIFKKIGVDNSQINRIVFINSLYENMCKNYTSKIDNNNDESDINPYSRPLVFDLNKKIKRIKNKKYELNNKLTINKHGIKKYKCKKIHENKYSCKDNSITPTEFKEKFNNLRIIKSEYRKYNQLIYYLKQTKSSYKYNPKKVNNYIDNLKQTQKFKSKYY